MIAYKKDGMNENSFEKWYVAVIGIMGGGIHYTLIQVQAVPVSFFLSLLKASVTAFTCAFFGMTAKYAFNRIFKNKN